MQELDAGARLDARLAAFVNDLRHDLERREQREYRARTLVGRMALALQAALLLESGNAIVADAFCAARNRTLAELAFSWLASHREVSSIIAGATTPEQIDINVAAAGWRLAPDELAEIDRIAAAP